MLNEAQISSFKENGYLFLPDALRMDQLDRLRAQFDAWIEESRAYTTPYGETMMADRALI